MTLRYEIKKIISMPALLGFALVLIILNCVVIFNCSYGEEIDYINAVNKIAGNKFSASYTERLEALLPPDDGSLERWTHEDLLAAAENYDIRTAKFYAEEFEFFKQTNETQDSFLGETILSLMGSKYEKAQAEAARKLASGEINYVVFGSETARIFKIASSDVGMLMVCECALLAVLAVMYSLSYEHISGADILIYSTRKGRRKIALCKTAAAAIVSTVAYIAVFALGYGLYFALNDFSQIWNVPVSVYYNTVSVAMQSMPVLAWGDMTFLGYFVFSALLGYVLMLVFMLFACAVGLAAKNTYAGFGVLAFAVLLNVIFIIVPPSGTAGSLLVNMFPAGIISLMPAWFQYGSSLTLFCYQETTLSLIWLLVAVALSAFSLHRFTKKDLT